MKNLAATESASNLNRFELVCKPRLSLYPQTRTHDWRFSRERRYPARAFGRGTAVPPEVWG